jgi:mRNA interferase RelE/StbE
VTYHVEIERVATESLLRIARGDRVSARRLDAAIKELADDPRPARATKMVGLDALRMRIGDYRVVYVIDEAIRIVTVTRVAHRREVYDR